MWLSRLMHFQPGRSGRARFEVKASRQKIRTSKEGGDDHQHDLPALPWNDRRSGNEDRAGIGGKGGHTWLFLPLLWYLSIRRRRAALSDDEIMERIDRHRQAIVDSNRDRRGWMGASPRTMAWPKSQYWKFPMTSRPWRRSVASPYGTVSWTA